MSQRKLYLTLGLIAFAAFNITQPHAAQTQSTPRCAPEQRKELILSAIDKTGEPVDTIRPEHISLKVGGVAATISDVTLETRQPLDIAVLLDVSASQEKALPTAKAAARAFIASVATVGQDRVAVVSFSEKPNQVQALTSDLTAASAAIDKVQFEPPPGYIGGGVVVSTRPPAPGPVTGSTSLWDVVRSVTEELFRSRTLDRRRAVLLFTDGNDTSSSGKLNPVIAEAVKHDLRVFSIGLADSTNAGFVNEGSLKKLSEQTGGVALFPGNKDEKLNAALTEIARRLRASYVIGYCGMFKDEARIQLEILDQQIRNTKPVLAYKRY